MAKERNLYLDNVKGILIILVVWAHSIQLGFGFNYGNAFLCLDDYIFKTIYSFHMPLFMAISGYLFCFSNTKSFKDVCRTKLLSIGIPYLSYCTLTLVLAYKQLLTDPLSALWATYKNGFWFLTSFLLNCLIVAVITRAVKLHAIRIFCYALVTVIMMIIPGQYIYQTHAYMFPIFALGYVINERQIRFRIRKWMLAPSILILCITGLYFSNELYVYTSGVCIMGGQQLNTVQLNIDLLRWVIALINSLCFMIVIYYLQSKVRKTETIQRLSRLSIGIYCLSMFFQHTIYKLMHFFNIEIPYNYITPVLYGIVMLIACERILMLCEKNKVCKLLFLGGR